MSPKSVLYCFQAFLVQTVLSQCLAGPEIAPAAFGPALAYDRLATPFGYDAVPCWAGNGIYPSLLSTMEFTPTSGGGLPVTSGSAIPPTGISLVSENAYEGILSVAGELPFVGTTAMEGVVPSVGAGAINHACGNGVNALTALSPLSSPASVATSEYVAPYGVAPLSPGLVAPGAAPGFVPSGIAATAYAAATHASPTLPCDEGFLDAPYDIEFTATNGGALPVASGSSVPPTGLAVASETVYEGTLAAAGELPFVGTVEVEGVLPTAGAGAVNHACGNGLNTMVSDNAAFVPGYAGAAYAPTNAFASPAATTPGFGYRGGWAGRGYGCGL